MVVNMWVNGRMTNTLIVRTLGNTNRKKYKELDEKKYPGIKEKEKRMNRAINEGDSEAF
jgi:hypothetical protein